jgi:hypothetical protein
MIINSDNNAATSLRKDSRIGVPSVITGVLHKDLGLSSKTVVGNGGPDNSGSLSTANDFTKFLEKLDKKDLPGVKKDNNYSYLLGLMKKSLYNGSRDIGMPKGIGGNTVVADKKGWSTADPKATNDVGIVYLSGKTYYLAILTSNGDPGGWSGVEKISKEVNTLMGGASSGDQGCAASGSIQAAVELAMKYAWADGSHGTQQKKEYADALRKARSTDKKYYEGGCGGNDCGGFVTRVMRDSADPNYNDNKGNTIGQEEYLKSHPDKYQSLGSKTSIPRSPARRYCNKRSTHLYVYWSRKESPRF